MAKNCKIAKEAKRAKLIKQYIDRRKELRKAQSNKKLSDEKRLDAMFNLSKLPRDSSPSRYTSRCQATGAPRSVYKKFGLNRISFRNMANAGLLPGVTKSSW